ncbi:hypothetical protein HKX48_007257 [Thoreauomyces humboldtii]|nr:hypothetical protein HKX48_007257 [Thoreauomyces humboldtii]
MLELLVIGINPATFGVISRLFPVRKGTAEKDHFLRADLCDDSDQDGHDSKEHEQHCRSKAECHEEWLKEHMLVVDDDRADEGKRSLTPSNPLSLPCLDIPLHTSNAMDIQPISCPCDQDERFPAHLLPLAKFCDHFRVSLADGKVVEARNVVIARPNRQTAIPEWAAGCQNGLVQQCQGCGRVVVVGHCLATCEQALSTFSHVVMLLPDHLSPAMQDPLALPFCTREKPDDASARISGHHRTILSRAVHEGRLTLLECVGVQGASYAEDEGIWELWLSDGSWVISDWVCILDLPNPRLFQRVVRGLFPALVYSFPMKATLKKWRRD